MSICITGTGSYIPSNDFLKTYDLSEFRARKGVDYMGNKMIFNGNTTF